MRDFLERHVGLAQGDCRGDAIGMRCEASDVLAEEMMGIGIGGHTDVAHGGCDVVIA